jgi:hypothetical protein
MKMDSLGYMGYIFGLVAFVWCFTLQSQVGSLKRLIQDAGIGHMEKSSLKEILEKNIGKSADLKLETSGFSFQTILQNCRIQEVDEEWVLLLEGKKEIEKLVRIQTIQSVNLK